MRKYSQLIFSALCLLFLLAASFGPAAMAATKAAPGTGEALEIAPPLITLTANRGQTVKATIKLRDIAKGPLVVSNQINDFVANGEDGTPKIIEGSDPNNPYSILNWIAPLPSFTLKPQQITNLPVTIHVPSNASAGGHYGVIRFTGTAPSLNGTGVALSASIGTLVLLTVNGQLHHNLSVKEFSTNKAGKNTSLFQSSPVNFTVRLQNNGNVQELPTGHIAINDMFGKNIANVLVNSPPHNILPSSIRKFTAQLGQSTIGNKRLFGRYTATLKINYGVNNKQELTAKLSFWVIPYKLIAIIIAAIIVGFFILRYAIKRYNRYIVNRTNSGRR